MTTYRTSPATLRAIAITMLGIELLIHAALAPDHLDEIPYIGALFLVAAAALGVVIAMLVELPNSRVPWLIGTALCAGMLAAFLLSRTLGLPGFHEEWLSDNALGIAAIPPEVVFIACAGYALRRTPRAATREPAATFVDAPA